MQNCLWDQKPFEPLKPNQRFCKPECRIAYHNEEKARGIRLTPEIRAKLQDLAEIHGISINEMACKMLHQLMNPDGRPLTDDEIGLNGAGKKPSVDQGGTP